MRLVTPHTPLKTVYFRGCGRVLVFFRFATFLLLCNGIFKGKKAIIKKVSTTAHGTLLRSFHSTTQPPLPPSARTNASVCSLSVTAGASFCRRLKNQPVGVFCGSSLFGVSACGRSHLARPLSPRVGRPPRYRPSLACAPPFRLRARVTINRLAPALALRSTAGPLRSFGFVGASGSSGFRLASYRLRRSLVANACPSLPQRVPP